MSVKSTMSHKPLKIIRFSEASVTNISNRNRRRTIVLKRCEHVSGMDPEVFSAWHPYDGSFENDGT